MDLDECSERVIGKTCIYVYVIADEEMDYIAS